MMWLSYFVALILLSSGLSTLISRVSLGDSSSVQVETSKLDAVKIDLVPITAKTHVDGPATPVLTNQESTSFGEGKKVRIQLIATNNSQLPVVAPVLDTYYQNRPELWLGQDRVPYRDDIEQLLPRKDKSPEFMRFARVTLPPGQSVKLEILDLSQWYDPLKVGQYRLSNRHRFCGGCSWLETSSVWFEITVKRGSKS